MLTKDKLSERDNRPLFSVGEPVKYKNGPEGKYLVKGVCQSNSGMFIYILDGNDGSLYYEPEHLLMSALPKLEIHATVNVENVEIQIVLDDKEYASGFGNIYSVDSEGILQALALASHAAYKNYQLTKQ
ncbi:MAG: hypothetical protein IJX38_01205 [Clostridia bacterium]|nr:hypothetical protein [Clostridia bacterium]